MTSADLVAVLLRRWYVVLAGFALTAAAVYAFASSPGVYSTQADVLFLAPKSAKFPNPIESSSESLIATAGLVARIANSGSADPPTASSGVPLTGEGIRKGYSIRLPNSGGQWANNFDRPVLVVQVAGPSEEWVRSTLATQIGVIDRSLFTLQKSEGVAKENFIITSSAPRQAKVEYLKGDPKRAIAAMMLLSSVLTALAAIGFDRIAPQRRQSLPLPASRTESL